MSLLGEAGLIIANGRFQSSTCPDPPFTCFHHRGGARCSIVDYVLVPKNLLSQIESCRVLPRVRLRADPGRALSDHAPILTTVRLTPSRDAPPPSAASGLPPRTRFHSSRLKDDTVRRMFTHMVEQQSLAQRPHFDRLKRLVSRKEISTVEFAKESNQLIVDILQHAAECVLGRIRLTMPSTRPNPHSSAHYSARDPELRQLQYKLQQAKHAVKWAKRHAPEQLSEWSAHRNVARAALWHEKRARQRDSLLGDVTAVAGQEHPERAQSMWYYLRRYKSDHVQSTLPHQIYSNANATIGLRWRLHGTAQPKRGCGLLCDDLAAALQAKTEFSPAELQAFHIRGRLHHDCISTLRPDDWIQSGPHFFCPIPGDLRVWTRGPLTTCARAWHDFRSALGQHLFGHPESPYDEREAAEVKRHLQHHVIPNLSSTAPDSLLERAISREEVECEIRKSKPDKSPGDDGITNRMIRSGGENFCSLLHEVFNTLWEYDTQPAAWHYSLLQPIHKGGTKLKCDPASYRGISLCSALSQAI